MQGHTCTCLSEVEMEEEISKNQNYPPLPKKCTITCLLWSCVHDLPPTKPDWEVWPGHVAFIPAVVVPENSKARFASRYKS